MDDLLTLLTILLVVSGIGVFLKIANTAKDIAAPAARIKNVKNVIAETREKMAGRVRPMQLRLDEALATHSIPIAVFSFGLKTPDLSYGHDAYVGFFNTGHKTIKYAKFSVSFINAVGDKTPCMIRGVSDHVLEVTGPIASGNDVVGQGAIFAGAVYGGTISFMKLNEVSIEYMDGTTYAIDGNAINDILLDPAINNAESDAQQLFVISSKNKRLDVFYKQIFERLTSSEFEDINLFELL